MSDISHTPYEVLGIGTPIVDQIIQVSDAFIAKIPGTKGGADSVDYKTLLNLIKTSGKTPSLVIGGSTTNTIKGLSRLGWRCAIFGRIGSDEPGKLFLQQMHALGIKPHLLQGDLPTAQVACLISPDYERTMRSFLGAGTQMRAEDLLPEMFEGVQLVHIEGYTLDYGKLPHRAMELAKQAGARISFDLSSFEIAREHKKTIIELVSKYVDIVFANEEEAKALTGLNPERGCQILKDMSEMAVVKMGKQGSWAAYREVKSFQPAFDVQTLDTTGAGDLFASGFLHGYLSEKPLKECSRYGALIASEVVQVVGADIPQESWQQIKKQLA